MMTTNPKFVVPLLEQMNTLAKALAIDNGFVDENSRVKFIEAAEKLAIAARYHDENVFFVVTKIMQAAAIRTACSLNIFSVVPSAESTSISASDVASATKADKKVVVRIMRALVSCHIFTEAGEELYAHNQLSRGFLVSESLSMFTEIYDLACKGAYALPEFL